jgi:hypothetical protein
MMVLGILSLGGVLYPQVPDTKTLPVLKRGIEELQLGKTLEEIQEALKKSPYFNYRGPRDVSFLPLRSEPVIDTEGMRYLQRGIFQFQEGKLVTIILYVNPKYLDYPTLFQHFSSRYGTPQYLDPKSCFWEDGATRVALEKPLVIKFVEKNILPPGKDGRGGLPLSPEELGRRQFLELF